jgi:hypothetical protein
MIEREIEFEEHQTKRRKVKHEQQVELARTVMQGQDAEGEGEGQGEGGEKTMLDVALSGAMPHDC